MEVVTFKVPPDLARWLDEQARALGCPKSEIVRRAIERLRSDGRERSALDRAGDAVGRVASGTADLATNKEHLRGFGR